MFKLRSEEWIGINQGKIYGGGGSGRVQRTSQTKEWGRREDQFPESVSSCMTLTVPWNLILFGFFLHLKNEGSDTGSLS